MDKPVISGNTIKIPTDLKYLTDVDDFIEGFLRDCGAEESVVADIAISVSELVNNAVANGSQYAPDQPIIITIDKMNGAVTITVSDQGTGFNPDDIADPLADENLLKEAGRGIFIVRSLMDAVDINASCQGTTVTITKAL
ncbi:MAG: ATP-binding protein [Candidatus Zixiibacteriota bacterium]|nr:MAG: ATP-binding protein [candidate division Zixibacteria bacterium]